MSYAHDVFDFTTTTLAGIPLEVRAGTCTGKHRLDSRGCEQLCGYIRIQEGGEVHTLRFYGFYGSPLHATDSGETLAALLSLVTHGTDAEEVGSLLSHELTRNEEYYVVPLDPGADLWARYYDSRDEDCAPWAIIWGDKIYKDGLSSLEEAEEIASAL